MVIRIICVYWLHTSYDEVADITSYLIKSYDPSKIHKQYSSNKRDFGKAYSITEENANFLLIKYPQYIKLLKEVIHET